MRTSFLCISLLQNEQRARAFEGFQPPPQPPRLVWAIINQVWAVCKRRYELPTHGFPYEIVSQSRPILENSLISLKFLILGIRRSRGHHNIVNCIPNRVANIAELYGISQIAESVRPNRSRSKVRADTVSDLGSSEILDPSAVD